MVEMTIDKSFKKVLLSLCLIKHYSIKIYGGSGRISQPFLTSSLHVGEWLISPSDRFVPEEIIPDTHCIRGWVAHRLALYTMEKKKSCPCLESNPGRLARSPSLYWLIYSVDDTIFFWNFLQMGHWFRPGTSYLGSVWCWSRISEPSVTWSGLVECSDFICGDKELIDIAYYIKLLNLVYSILVFY
jgi:hypothetical protein